MTSFNKRFILVAIAVVLFPFLGFGGEAEHRKINIMVEDAAIPWSNPDGTGIANDIVVAAFKEMNVEAHLIVVPYARCKAAVLSGNIVACFNMTWTPAFKDLIQLASTPLIYLNADIFENSEHPLPKPENGKCELPKGTQVGTVIGYEYPDEVDKLLASGISNVAVKSDSQNLSKLSLGRIQAAVIMTNNFQPKNQKAIESKTDTKVRFAFSCGIETGSIGFSLKHKDGPWALKTYEEGITKIQKNGVMDKIVKRFK